MLHAPSFKPYTWHDVPHEHRVYLDSRAQSYTIVSEEDYQWAVQWCWLVKRAGQGTRQRNDPGYAYRTLTLQRNGVKIRSSLYLHVEIMKRACPIQPTPTHINVDHKDRDHFNCQRGNLQWATPSMNAINRPCRERLTVCV